MNADYVNMNKECELKRVQMGLISMNTKESQGQAYYYKYNGEEKHFVNIIITKRFPELM